jgi:hypothetical protein
MSTENRYDLVYIYDHNLFGMRHKTANTGHIELMSTNRIFGYWDSDGNYHFYRGMFDRTSLSAIPVLANLEDTIEEYNNEHR